MTCMDKFHTIINTGVLSFFSYIAECFCILTVVMIMLCFLGREGKITGKSVIPLVAFLGAGTCINIFMIIHDYLALKDHWNEPFFEGKVKLINRSQFNIYVSILVIIAIVSVILITFTDNKIMNCFIAGVMMIFYEFYISVEMMCSTIYLFPKTRNYVLKGSFIYENIGDTFSGIFIFVYLLIMLGSFLVIYLSLYKKGRTLYIRWRGRILLMVWEVSMICLTYAPLMLVKDKKSQQRCMGYEMGMLIPLMGFVVPGLLILIVSARNAMEKTIIQEEYIAAELEFINQYKKNQNEIRAFRHDIINNLSMLNTLHNEKGYDEAEDYLKELMDNVREMSSKYATGDEMLDCIVGMKSFKMEEEGIDFAVDGTLKGGLEMKPVDICSIFANAIDNAIDACGMIPKGEKKWIKMFLNKTEDSYCVTIQNSMQNVENGNMIREKNKIGQDSNRHGYGIQSMINTISKYKGNKKIKPGDGIFTLTINLPIEKAAD